MDIFAVAAVSLCAVVIAALLKQKNGEYALLLSMITVIMILMFVLQKAAPLAEEIERLAGADLLGETYIPILLKAVGITIITQATMNICKDGGQNALAYAVDMTGKISVLLLCLPVISRIFEYIRQILSL